MFYVVLFIVIFSANIQYLFDGYLIFIFFRDILFLLLLLFYFVLYNRFPKFFLFFLHLILAGLFFIFILVRYLTDQYSISEYLHYFIRNLFYYPIVLMIVLNNKDFNVYRIIDFVFFLNIAGIFFQYTNLLPSIFEYRFVGFYLSPTIGAIINLGYLYYLFKNNFKGGFYPIYCLVSFVCIILSGTLILIPLSLIFLIAIIRFNLLWWVIVLVFIVLQWDNMYLRLLNIISGDLGTFTVRFNSLINFGTDRPFFEFIKPYDSTFIFINHYIGFFPAIIFFLFKLYLFLIVRKFMRIIPKFPPVHFLLFLVLFQLLSHFVFNSDFSFIYNLFLYCLFMACHLEVKRLELTSNRLNSSRNSLYWH